jgi:hypothetical protein
VDTATWIADESTKSYARTKIEALTVAIGYASIASDDASLDDYYKQVIEKKRDFIRLEILKILNFSLLSIINLILKMHMVTIVSVDG